MYCSGPWLLMKTKMNGLNGCFIFSDVESWNTVKTRNIE